jgi:arginine/lysine/ornithine decarboxylase
MTEPFTATESELSDEAKAILAYARKWGEPFTRHEITTVAPGAAWDPFSRWPSTVAELDPLRELARAGLVEEYDEQPVKGRRGRTYKRWALTEVVLSLDELLDELTAAVRSEVDGREAGRIRAKIVRRFGRG